MSIAIDPSIFRDYDIRGIYPSQLNEKTVFRIGQAIAVYLNCKTIAVGYDMRLSSPSLFYALSEGIRSQGVNVVDLGQISTEMLYFASGYYKFPASVIISASHNPPQYNGLKIVSADVTPLHGGYGLPDIKKLAISHSFTSNVKKGSVESTSIIDDWIHHASSFVQMSNLKQLKVVVDAGNGMGGVSWKRLQGKSPLNILPLYFQPDGKFPHHMPDPIKENNLMDLKKEIIREKADVGFALDGDADRIFAVDEKGHVISGTVMTAMLAGHMLKKYGPAPVLYNAVCGRIVPEVIIKYKGQPVRVRVGHSFIKEYMKKYHALFAGEHSGHFYFRDNYYAESSLIAGLLFLEYLSGQSKPLSTIVREYTIYHESKELNFKVENPHKILKNIESKYTDAKSTDFIDGLSVWYPDWWFNLRASKTEPFVRLNIEANTHKLLIKKEKLLISRIISLGGMNI